MKRMQITDRNEYDFEDRVLIMSKSDGKCAHCGTQLVIGKNATVDHFIPLRKGGINQKINTIMLCRACNKAKGSKVLDAKRYVRHLKPKYMKELCDYADSYTQSFEYISRGNLLCFDEYTVKVCTQKMPQVKNRKKLDELMDKMSQSFKLERAYPDDIPEIEAYYIDYLKKYDCLESEEVARKNIEFWYAFGTIYMVRNPQGELRMIFPITAGRYADKTNHLTIHVFATYATKASNALTLEVPRFIAERLGVEQKLPYVRVATYLLAHDSNSRFLRNRQSEAGYALACSFDVFIGDRDVDPKEFNEDVAHFYRQFHDVRKYMDSFFSRPGYEDVAYMGCEIIPNYDQKRLQAQEQRRQKREKKGLK